MSNNAASLVLVSNQIALQQAMDVVANNIANVGTTGFKREGVMFNSYLKAADPNSHKPVAFVVTRGTYRDTSNGPIVNTGNPLDLAIQGKGYFQVKTPDGKTGYTRAGVFQLSTEGNVVNQSGAQLIGDGGPVTIPNTVSQVNISEDGFVTARVDNGTTLAQIGKIHVYSFENEQKMQAQGGGVYTTSEAPVADTTSSIKQGAIEQSNVQPVLEMTDMIRIMRGYEEASNIISNENQRQNDAVSRLEKVTS